MEKREWKSTTDGKGRAAVIRGVVERNMELMEGGRREGWKAIGSQITQISSIIVIQIVS